MTYNFTRALLSFMLSLLLLTPYAYALDKSDAVKIMLPNSNHMQFVGYYMAKHKGLFLKSGVAVELAVNQDVSNTSELVVAGKATYAVGNSELLLARSQGARLVALAAIFQHSPVGLLSLRQNSIHQLTDLSNKSIMLRENEQDMELIALLRKFKVASRNTTVNTRDLKLDALINKQFDALSMTLMAGTQDLVARGISPVTFMPKDYGIDFYSDYLFTTEQEVENFPTRVAKVQAAVLSGWQYALNHPKESLNLLMDLASASQTAGSPPAGLAALRQEYERQLLILQDYIQPDLIPLGYINQQRLQEIVTILMSVDLMGDDSNFSHFIYKAAPLYINWGIWDFWIKIGLSTLFLNGLWLSYLLFVNQKLKREVRERIKAERLVRHAAMHDHLTGLPNRACLMEKLSRAFKYANLGGASPALLFMDLDNFKLVNDQFGHKSGDELLVAATQRMSNLLTSDKQVLARLGGDEFVILLSDADFDTAQALSHDIKRTLMNPFALSNCTTAIGISIGISAYAPNMSMDEMLTAADDRMYAVKNEPSAKVKNVC